MNDMIRNTQMIFKGLGAEDNESKKNNLSLCSFGVEIKRETYSVHWTELLLDLNSSHGKLT